MYRSLPEKLSKRTSCDRINLIHVTVNDFLLYVLSPSYTRMDLYQANCLL